MPYIPRFSHLLKMTFRLRDPKAAEALWFEGTWLHDNDDDEGALLAFAHSKALDPDFAGAFYNYAALTEKKHGASPQTITAWETYLRVAEKDRRQARDTIERVKDHVAELKGKVG